MSDLKATNTTKKTKQAAPNTKTLAVMKDIIAQKQAKSASQKGLAGIDKTIGEKRKKIYVKKTGGLFDK